MKKLCHIAFAFVAAVAICHAEPRWCSIIDKGLSDQLFYPPIAKAAHVHGVVLARIIYSSDGKVEKVEPIFGPRLLATPLSGQVKAWTIKTNAVGDALCETLVIAKFHLNAPSCNSSVNPPPNSMDITTPSILRLELTATPFMICDPAFEVGHSSFIRRIANLIKRGFHQPSREDQ